MDDNKKDLPATISAVQRVDVEQINSALKEFQKSIDTIKKSGALTNFQKQIQSIKFQDPFKDIKRALATYEDPFSQFRKNIEGFNRQNPFEEFRKNINSVLSNQSFKEFQINFQNLSKTDPFADIRKNINHIISQTDFTAIQAQINAVVNNDSFKNFQRNLRKIQATSDTYKNVFITGVPANTFEEAFNEITAHYFEAVSLNEENPEDVVAKVVEDFSEDANKFALSKLSLEFYLNLLIALMFFVYSQSLSQESETRISNQLSITQELIVERLDNLIEIQNDETYYVVHRNVNLREAPTTKSAVKTVLYRNQKVILVQRKSKWIQVEYYDHILGVHLNGWCYKKYLKMMK